MSGRKPFNTLVSKMSPAAQSRVAEKVAVLQAEMPLNELRAAMDLSQTHLAEVLKVDQPTISKMERRTDMLISTLGRFVQAMGGSLELVARFPDGQVKISGFSEVRKETDRLAGEKRHQARPA